MQRAEGLAGGRHGVAGGGFIGDVGHHAAGIDAQRRSLGLDSGGDVHQQHLGARLDQPLGGGGAQPGGGASDQENLVVDLHDESLSNSREAAWLRAAGCLRTGGATS
ncbi:hypothetical protein D3C78_1708110 [compost metagenome]